MHHIVSSRFPSKWRNRFTSDQLRAWVLDWIREPLPFDNVPAPGPFKVSIRFSQREFEALKRLRRRNMSAVIRGIAALHVSVPEESGGTKLMKSVFGTAVVLLGIFFGVGRQKGQK